MEIDNEPVVRSKIIEWYVRLDKIERKEKNLTNGRAGEQSYPALIILPQAAPPLTRLQAPPPPARPSPHNLKLSRTIFSHIGKIN